MEPTTRRVHLEPQPIDAQKSQKKQKKVDPLRSTKINVISLFILLKTGEALGNFVQRGASKEWNNDMDAVEREIMGPAGIYARCGQTSMQRYVTVEHVYRDLGEYLDPKKVEESRKRCFSETATTPEARQRKDDEHWAHGKYEQLRQLQKEKEAQKPFFAVRRRDKTGLMKGRKIY